ncbi:MAG TPA: hypothetical protein VG844_06470 [Terracidiphilus sp.]|nr:hypothetical protein [Terracidiphilus sp.]
MRRILPMLGLLLVLEAGLVQIHAQMSGQQGAEPMGSMAMHHGKHVKPTGPLTISFNGKKSAWPLARLSALPHTTITVYNEHTKKKETYAGVPLTDLLTPLGVPAKPHGKDFKLYVVVEGADGYKVVYSAAEVTPDVHDATVLVADTEDGKPIGDDGPLKLVATGEKRPARWVRNLASISVETVQ